MDKYEHAYWEHAALALYADSESQNAQSYSQTDGHTDDISVREYVFFVFFQISKKNMTFTFFLKWLWKKT